MASREPQVFTLFFSDIERSTELLVRLPERCVDLLDDHDRIISSVVAKYRGEEIDRQGDSVFAVFRDAADGLAAAVETQAALEQHRWPDDAALRVRIGLHQGPISSAISGLAGRQRSRRTSGQPDRPSARTDIGAHGNEGLGPRRRNHRTRFIRHRFLPQPAERTTPAGNAGSGEHGEDARRPACAPDSVNCRPNLLDPCSLHNSARLHGGALRVESYVAWHPPASKVTPARRAATEKGACGQPMAPWPGPVGRVSDRPPCTTHGYRSVRSRIRRT